MKKGFFKRLIKSIVQSPIVRGVVKSLPGGNLLYEVGENVVGNVVNEIAKSKEIKPRDIKPHNWVSMAVQFICISLILYAFFTHQITIKDVLHLLGYNQNTILLKPEIINAVTDSIQ